MPAASPHPAKKNESGRPIGAGTHAVILHAAEEEFARSGLAGARTDAIAASAGVNKAMLYYYFKSKDQLYEAVVEDHFKGFQEKAIAVLEADAPARKVLMNYVELHFDFISARHRYASLYQQLMFSGGKPMERLVKKYFAPRAEALDRLLERGMKNGEFRRTDRRHTAVSITALIVFYFSAAPPVLQIIGKLDAFTEANLSIRKKEVMDFIRFGLFSDPEGSAT